MLKTKFELLNKNFHINLDDNFSEKYCKFENLFKEYNAHTNLISKNDEKFLFEKHFYDSLSINLFFEKYKIKPDKCVLDFGTGGGFPSIPISLIYENIEVTALDSIAKKIKFVELLKQEFNQKNLIPVADRVENLFSVKKFDIVVSRAVCKIDKLIEYTSKLIKKDGYLICYKALSADKEIDEAKSISKKLNLSLFDKIEYTLPTEEKHKRNLVIYKKL